MNYPAPSTIKTCNYRRKTDYPTNGIFQLRMRIEREIYTSIFNWDIAMNHRNMFMDHESVIYVFGGTSLL